MARHARALGLTGHVRNLPQGRAVEVRAEGERERLEELLKLLEAGPPGAWVERVNVEWSQHKGESSGFEVRYSGLNLPNP